MGGTWRIDPRKPTSTGLSAATETSAARVEHLPLAVASVGDDPEAYVGLVSLVGVEQVGGKLGRFTKAERQQPGRQGVKGAGMVGLGCRIQTARGLQRRVRGHATAFIEQQNAIDALPDPSY